MTENQIAPQQSGMEEDEIRLRDYGRVIYRHRTMIITISILCAIIAAIVSFLLPRSYRAVGSVVPPLELGQKGSVLAGKLKGAEGALLGDFLDTSSMADLYSGILKSRSVQDAIVNEFDLKSYYGLGYQSRARMKLRKNTTIHVLDEGIVEVAVEDRDPNMAAAMVNAYIDKLDKQNKRIMAGQASSKRIFLKNRLEEIKQELSEIENLLSREARIKEMLYELLTKEYELAKIEEAKSMPTIQILDKAVPPQFKYKPKRRVIVASSFGVGLFAAIFFAFLRDGFTDTDDVK